MSVNAEQGGKNKHRVTIRRGPLETGAELGMNRQWRERERQLGPGEPLQKGQDETQPGQVKSSVCWEWGEHCWAGVCWAGGEVRGILGMVFPKDLILILQTPENSCFPVPWGSAPLGGPAQEQGPRLELTAIQPFLLMSKLVLNDGTYPIYGLYLNLVPPSIKWGQWQYLYMQCLNQSGHVIYQI